ncbi:MAG TPA: phosphohydrolase [Chloroflexi bacterium]|nr:phosphohydrolase [Chloroflexota bacterium]
MFTSIPNPQQAQDYLNEAEARNPGPWVAHSLQVAEAAQRIAAAHPELDPEVAHTLGLLHDIGRRAGIAGMRHVVDGYYFLIAEGFPTAARICLTHSYPIPNVRAGSSVWDGSTTEKQFVAEYLAQIEYTPYDRLIQLCDALCLPRGPVLMEKRMVDVTLRHGSNEFTTRKWQAFFDIQKEFETIIGQSLYSLLPGVVENTFGFTP